MLKNNLIKKYKKSNTKKINIITSKKIQHNKYVIKYI